MSKRFLIVTCNVRRKGDSLSIIKENTLTFKNINTLGIPFRFTTATSTVEY